MARVDSRTQESRREDAMVYPGSGERSLFGFGN
jgi:hypothetical protein